MSRALTVSTEFAATQAAYGQTPWFAFGALVAAIVAVFVLELTLGPVNIRLSDVLAALTGGAASSDVIGPIVLQFRLPRAFNAFLSGAALGACGLILQTVFRNPLADPFILGVVFGARFGVAFLIVVTGTAGNALLYRYGLLGDMAMALASALGTVLVLALLLILSRRVSTVTLLVAGLMLGYLFTGLISVVMHFVDENQARAFNSWSDGSFAGATFQQLRILTPLVIVGLLAAWSQVKPLNSLLLGESYAQSLGLSVERARLFTFGLLAVLVGTVTAFCGPIAFIGIVTAHLCRLLFKTADHAILMPAVMLMGALLALGADLITHLPWSRHFLHLNAVNGLIGAPIVLWALLDRRHARSLEL
jgi:iron complex transport system permease protein